MPDGFDRETGEVIEQRPQLPAMAESRPQNLIFASPECAEVFGALCDMQGSMSAPKRTKNAKVKGRTAKGVEYEYQYNYAPLEEIVACIKEPMAKAGLSHRQFLAVRDGRWLVRTIIAHRSGQWFGCDYPIFWDESRGMQGFASGKTYACRQGLSMTLGLAPEDDDDANVADGNVATVQDRRQTGSRGRTATKEPETTVTPPPLTNGTTAPTEDFPAPHKPTSEEYDLAVQQIKLARQAIDGCKTVADLDTILKSKEWDACQRTIHKGRPGKSAEKAIQALIELAEDRKLALAGGPMTVGEMG